MVGLGSSPDVLGCVCGAFGLLEVSWERSRSRWRKRLLGSSWRSWEHYGSIWGSRLELLNRNHSACLKTPKKKEKNGKVLEIIAIELRMQVVTEESAECN